MHLTHCTPALLHSRLKYFPEFAQAQNYDKCQLGDKKCVNSCKLVITLRNVNIGEPCLVFEKFRLKLTLRNGIWESKFLAAFLRRERRELRVCEPQLTLYPPASFITSCPGFEVVGVALAAPVHELAAALRVPVVVVTGDAGSAGPFVRGQEAGLRVVPYSPRRRTKERDGVSHISGKGESSRGTLSPPRPSKGASAEGEGAHWGRAPHWHGSRTPAVGTWGRRGGESGCRGPRDPPSPGCLGGRKPDRKRGS